MFYLKNGNQKLFIECDNVYTCCPACEVEHVVDLGDMVTDNGLDIYGTASYCPECSRKIAPMWAHDAEIQAITARFPSTDIHQVRELVRGGLLRGLSIEAVLVGVRMALATASGKEEYFTLDDAAAALNCTREEAATEMKRLGISPVKLTTIPGFEWLLDPK